MCCACAYAVRASLVLTELAAYGVAPDRISTGRDDYVQYVTCRSRNLDLAIHAKLRLRSTGG